MAGLTIAVTLAQIQELTKRKGELLDCPSQRFLQGSRHPISDEKQVSGIEAGLSGHAQSSQQS